MQDIINKTEGETCGLFYNQSKKQNFEWNRDLRVDRHAVTSKGGGNNNPL